VGPGLWNATPRGGSDSVHPAWRKAYVEFVVSETWTPLDKAAEAASIQAMKRQYLPALQRLAGPGSGSYLNEDCPYDPWLNDAFWGPNYPRLRAIKRWVDPEDVFWCSSCVGREGWEETDDGKLCRV